MEEGEKLLQNKNNYYIILPDTIDIMPQVIQNAYNKKYHNIPRLDAPLRSDQNMLNDADVITLLEANGLLK